MSRPCRGEGRLPGRRCSTFGRHPSTEFAEPTEIAGSPEQFWDEARRPSPFAGNPHMGFCEGERVQEATSLGENADPKESDNSEAPQRAIAPRLVPTQAHPRRGGHSRDDKPRNPQVLVGLVLVDSRRIAHHVFQGNWRDANRIPEVLRDLERRFGLKRLVFVGDRGMVTSHNLDLMRGRGHGYLVGRNRRRSGEGGDYIQARPAPGLSARSASPRARKQRHQKILVQGAASNKPSV
jgi:hypothetical protein